MQHVQSYSVPQGAARILRLPSMVRSHTESGISPVNWLPLNLATVMRDAPPRPGGTFPVNSLFCICNIRILTREPIGISPDSSLFWRKSRMRFVERFSGTFPVRPLSLRRRTSSSDNFAIFDGMLPDRLLSSKPMIWRNSKKLISEGREPIKLFSGITTCVMLPLSHTLPNHTHSERLLK